jgi:hypothetical protein
MARGPGRRRDIEHRSLALWLAREIFYPALTGLHTNSSIV